MTPLTINTISRLYLMLALVVAVVICPPPYSLVALALLIVQIYSSFRPSRAGINLALTVFTLILTPLALGTLLRGPLSAFLVIPALPLLDYSLRRASPNQVSPHFRAGRKPTTALQAVVTSLLLVLVASTLLANQTLALTTIFLAGYLGAILAYILYRIPRLPLEESKTRLRSIAGDIAEHSVTIKGKTKIPLHILLQAPYPWIRLDPSELKLRGDEAEISLVIIPQLAGPSKLQLQALVIDPWGLIQTNQTLEPIELYVIPRARYAEWLAKRYLELTTAGIAPQAVGRLPALRGTRRGEEYYGSRLYQPGDRLRDIDWKHTFKLRDLIVIREFIEAPGQSVIIAVNLAVEDPEEADKLAYNLITLALTLAREAIPTALAAYDHKEVLMTTPPLNPREILKRTLRLTQNITLVQPLDRFLQPPDIPRLKRDLNQLRQTKLEPAQKLVAILQLEYQAMERAAKNHPATRALAATTRHTPPPALIAVISSHNHDTEAILVTLEKLREKGFRTLPVETKTKQGKLLPLPPRVAGSHPPSATLIQR